MRRDPTLHGDDEQERKEFVGRELVVGREQSLNGKLRDECLNGELFYSLKEAQIVIEEWRMQYKHPPATFLAGLPAAGAGSPSPRHLDQRNSTLAGCDVDSHSACTKPRSGQANPS